MDRLEVIQRLIDKRKLSTYLEIGVLGGENFFKVRCKRKIAVDPNFKFNWKGRVGQMLKNATNIFARFFETTSDDFFANQARYILKKGSLDIVLIDGMHEMKYVLNDVMNSLEYLSDNGVIVMHDCNPQSEEAACSFEQWKQRGYTGYWNGDVWKSIAYLIKSNPDIDVFVADCDHGLGIITKGKNKKINSIPDSLDKIEHLTYMDLHNRRYDLLNLQTEQYLGNFISK